MEQTNQKPLYQKAELEVVVVANGVVLWRATKPETWIEVARLLALKEAEEGSKWIEYGPGQDIDPEALRSRFKNVGYMGSEKKLLDALQQREEKRLKVLEVIKENRGLMDRNLYTDLIELLEETDET